MKIRNITLAMAVAAATAAWAGNYKVVITLPADFDGAMAFLNNYDTGQAIDSVSVDGGQAVFEGTVQEPALVRMTVDGRRSPVFILEEGTISFGSGKSASGTPLNDRYNQIGDELGKIVKTYQEAAQKNDTIAAQAAYDEYYRQAERLMLENIDNPVGLSLFMDQAYEMEPAELAATVEKYPQLKKSKRVGKLLEANKRKALTQPGNKFADFEVVDNGVTHKLSDVVGKGKPVLVDFWASWCGPCRAEMPNLKKIYSKYGDALKVLGVAVWDKPDDTAQAVKSLELPWEIWANGQTAPTDVYGISGIPCIVVFDGDGTIRIRDKVGAELEAALEELMAK